MQKDTWTIIGVVIALVGLLATFMVTGLASIEARLTAMDGRLHEMNIRISRIEGHLRLPAEVEPIQFEAIGLTPAAMPMQEFEYLYRSAPHIPRFMYLDVGQSGKWKFTVPTKMAARADHVANLPGYGLCLRYTGCPGWPDVRRHAGQPFLHTSVPDVKLKGVGNGQPGRGKWTSA